MKSIMMQFEKPMLSDSGNIEPSVAGVIVCCGGGYDWGLLFCCA